jgi:hypothetical protein
MVQLVTVSCLFFWGCLGATLLLELREGAFDVINHGAMSSFDALIFQTSRMGYP